MISFTNLTVKEADLVINALRKLPIEMALDLHNKLLYSATQQYAAIKQAEESKVPEEPKE